LPPVLKRRSTGAEEAGMANTRAASLDSVGYWTRCSRQNSRGLLSSATSGADRYSDSSLSTEDWVWVLVADGFLMKDKTLGRLVGGGEADVGALLVEEAGGMLSGHWAEMLLVMVETSWSSEHHSDLKRGSRRAA